jgi:hypothetical protein
MHCYETAGSQHVTVTAIRKETLTLTANLIEDPVEADSNTSIVVRRVVGGAKKGTQCLGDKIGPPCSWKI